MAIDLKQIGNEIQQEYDAKGHSLGWRLLTSPKANTRTARTALITINPGGSHFEAPLLSVEAGSAYEIERWKGAEAGQERLQRQVRRMFELAGERPMDVLSGYLVPFRSKGWMDLPERPAALAFGKTIWRELLRASSAKTVLCFGKDVAPHLLELEGGEQIDAIDACWGTLTMDVYRLGTGRSLIALPHLSRFALFNRPAVGGRSSEDQFAKALSAART